MADVSGVVISCNLLEAKRELYTAHYNCSKRGLVHSGKWLSELLFSLRDIDGLPTDSSISTDTHQLGNVGEIETYILVKSYFDLREYDRAAFFAASAKSHLLYFLYIYSKYMEGKKHCMKLTTEQQERVIDLAELHKFIYDTADYGNKLLTSNTWKKMNSLMDIKGLTLPSQEVDTSYLHDLRAELEKKYGKNELDGYGLYLYGIVLRKLQLNEEALHILCEALQQLPIHWGCWMELATLITDKETLSSLPVPDHWMKWFFFAHVFLELQMNQEALNVYEQLQNAGFGKSSYITAQTAICWQNMREVDQAVATFGQLQSDDPFRLDNMDLYSNLLYVKEMRVELSRLAHHVCEVDKYRVETCCVIGNYYSLRSQHEKAVVCFQRALKLNPNYLSAWTLMGHEFMEMKNTQAAIQAYRHAIEVNRRDYRAWYGLGQTYEILKMPFYSLYYYQQAEKLRPNDSRMLVALGDNYEKLDRLLEAKKCFWKAYSVCDVEGIALIKLARLYERLGEEDQAKAAYTEYIWEAEAASVTDREEQSSAYRYLANYCVRKLQFEEAYKYAQKCTEYPETREEGKALLKDIAQRRSSTETEPMNFDSNNVTSEQSSNDRLTRKYLTFTP